MQPAEAFSVTRVVFALFPGQYWKQQQQQKKAIAISTFTITIGHVTGSGSPGRGNVHSKSQKPVLLEEETACALHFSMSSATHFTHKGLCFPVWDNYAVEHFNYVENEFQLLDDDVVSVVYPKSGTNWMAEILSLIQRDGDPTWARSVLLWERVPWIENVETKNIILNSAPPRFMNTHLPFQLFPKSFLHSKAKVIYTVRNPKDVLVSNYYFAKAFKPLTDPGTLQDYLEKFLSENMPFGSWFDHVKGWLAMKDKPNFLFNSYEELKQDLRGSVERICRFLGKELSSQQIDSVVENASFETMKDNKMSNLSQASDTLMDHSKGKLMRKGMCGTWKSELTVAQNEHFDRVYQEKMRDVTMSFPWD